MFGALLDPIKRMQKRYRRSSSALQQLSDPVYRIACVSTRQTIAASFEKLLRADEYLGPRMDQLPLTRGKDFAWLREDAEKTLKQFEMDVSALIEAASQHELNDPRSDESKKTSSPSETSPSQNAGIEQGAQIEEARLEADSQEIVAPRRGSAKTRKQKGPARHGGAFDSPPKNEVTAAESQTQPSEVVPILSDAEQKFAELEKEVTDWRAELKGMAAELGKREKKVPEILTSPEWRRVILMARSHHRRAMEQVGLCRRWVRGGFQLMKARDDWKSDFRVAKSEVKSLAHRLEEISSGKAAEQIAAARPEVETQEVRETIPILPTKNDVRRQPVGLPSFRVFGAAVGE